ncbi:MAG: retropepsin-like aspartic protease [bacterium]
MGTSKRAPRSAPGSLAAAQKKGAEHWAVLAGVAVIGLVLTTLAIILTGAYLAPVFVKGWLWFGLTLLLAVGVPVAAGLWMVRPLKGFKRAAWFTGVWVIVPLLAVLGLSAGAPRHTAGMLRKHGHLPFEHVFGPTTRSSTTRFGESIALGWANLLHAKAVERRKSRGVVADRKTPQKRKSPKSVFYSGVHHRKAKPLDHPLPKGRPTEVRYVQRGGAIMVPVRLGRGNKLDKYSMILDTGATLSAIDRDTAKKLGIRLSVTPIQVELSTAAGPQSFPLAILDRIRVGTVEVRHLTVAICDPCAPPGLSGLLGLNFANHFVTTIDPRRKRLKLHQHRAQLNRIIDIEPFLQLTAVHGETTAGKFTVTGKVHNRSDRRILWLELSTALMDSKSKVLSRITTRLKKIPRRASQSFTLQGQTHQELMRYRLELVGAAW